MSVTSGGFASAQGLQAAKYIRSELIQAACMEGGCSEKWIFHALGSQARTLCPAPACRTETVLPFALLQLGSKASRPPNPQVRRPVAFRADGPVHPAAGDGSGLAPGGSFKHGSVGALLCLAVSPTFQSSLIHNSRADLQDPFSEQAALARPTGRTSRAPGQSRDTSARPADESIAVRLREQL